jgi:predicted nucleic acid-binding protein
LDAEHELCCCAPSLDEFAFSARSAAEHAEITHRLRTSFLYLPLAPAIDQLIVEIRSALWLAGKGRSAGVVDVAIAATALHSDATVLHYDADFDHIASVYPQFRSQWVVPRGSVD